MGTDPETLFASAKRADSVELHRQIQSISNSRIVTCMLSAVRGLMAVLNENRQVLALNEGFCAALGLDDPAEALGLRPGEILKCVHSCDNRGGCGTGRFCATCGAVLAITAALALNTPIERKCIITVNSKGEETDLCFMAKASPMPLEDGCFVLLCVQDITEQERRAELERIFLHNIRNTIMGMHYTVDLLSRVKGTERSQTIDRLRRISDNLVREVSVQKQLVYDSTSDITGSISPVSIDEIMDDLRVTISGHSAMLGKSVKINCPEGRLVISTDQTLLKNILANMLVNACEATDVGGLVRFWVETDDSHVRFRVWNGVEISEHIAERIFQRFFSTKAEPGRGLGTYSMKLFGEKILGGKVSFSTSAEEGTVFTLSLPK
jgi:K+-sensing histidine kinase KdpD